MSDEGDVDKAAVKLVEEDEAAGKTERSMRTGIETSIQLSN